LAIGVRLLALALEFWLWLSACGFGLNVFMNFVGFIGSFCCVGFLDSFTYWARWILLGMLASLARPI
jgi:hypothetical protein